MICRFGARHRFVSCCRQKSGILVEKGRGVGPLSTEFRTMSLWSSGISQLSGKRSFIGKYKKKN